MLEVSHNPDSLSAARRVIVRNLRKAKDSIRKLMDSKRPRGMRLRHNYDPLSSAIYLEAYSLVPVEAAIRTLKESGNVLAIDSRRMKQA